MHVTQKDLASVPETFSAYYDDDSNNEEIKVGYVVCFDPTAPLAAADGEWDEQARFRVVVKPKTANLSFPAGVISRIIRRQGSGSDYSSFVEIERFKNGSTLKPFVKANCTVGTTVLKVADDSWDLVIEGDASIATRYTRVSVAVAGETADTSTTAARKPVFGLL